jgi:hypothetical protein
VWRVGSHQKQLSKSFQGKGKSHHKPKGEKSKGKRLYITWDEGEELSSSSDYDNENIANLCLLGTHINATTMR